jgi:hypothetical protein
MNLINLIDCGFTLTSKSGLLPFMPHDLFALHACYNTSHGWQTFQLRIGAPRPREYEHHLDRYSHVTSRGWTVGWPTLWTGSLAKGLT